MKLSLRKTWLCRLIQDLSPTASGVSKGIVCNGITKYGHIDQLPVGFRIACIAFAVIGALGTVRWMASIVFASSLYNNLSTMIYMDKEEGPMRSTEECASNHVIDELTNRMQILELAFKEQVFARETITREITDQSDVYVSMDKKLDAFLEKLHNVSLRYADLESKFNKLAYRVQSDEIFGVVVIVVLMIQLFCIFRSRILDSIDKLKCANPNLTKFINNVNNIEKRPSSNPGTPKHMKGLRNEICVICFQRDNVNGLISRLTESMLRHLEGVKLTSKPFYAVFSLDDLRTMPHVKLYVIVVDLESRGLYVNGLEKDLVMAAVKYTKNLGAQSIVVITNDEGSKNLTAHSVYNSSIRLIKTNDCLQDLAANGTLFSMWQDMTSHQLSHLRRFVKTVLNAKLIMR